MKKQEEKGHAGKGMLKDYRTRESVIAATAAIAASIVPIPAKARPKPGQETTSAEKPPLQAERAGRQDSQSCSFSGGEARVEVIGEDQALTNLRITYETKGWSGHVDFFGPPHMGRILFVLPGAERSVVLTDKNVIVTLGHEAARRGQRNLVMEGMETHGNTYYYDLPEDVRGGDELQNGEVVPRLHGATMAEDPDGQGATLFFIGRNGHLRATRVERFSEPYATASIEVSSDARLLSAGSVAILAEPGRNVVLALNADFERRRIVREAVPLPDVAQGVPEIRRNNDSTIISFGNMEVLVLVGEPGNPHSVTIVTAGQ